MLTPRSSYGTDPTAQLRRLQSEMNRLFQSTVSPQAAGFPLINVYADRDGVAVTAEVPGVAMEDLEITVHRDTLTLSGERRTPDGASGFHRRERGAGRFVRTVSLPFVVDADRVDAHLEHGILRLSMPRPESDKPRTIKVRTS